MSYEFDLIVIGAGPAGEKGAAQAAYYGKRVALIEIAPEPGGAAVHTGTLPSKTLRETAIFLSGYRQSELYGISVSLNPQLAVPKLLSRKNAVRELEVARIRWNMDRHNVPILQGTARFVDPHTLDVAQPGGIVRRMTGEMILVATGSKPYQPSNLPFDDEDVDDSDTVLHIDRLPKTMTVIGGGVIGCEYACMFAAMHVKVTLIEGRPRLLPFLDLEMGERLRNAMSSLGIDVRLDESVKSCARVEGRGIVCTLASGHELESEKLLAASGRSGRTEELGLEAIGVAVDKRGYVQVDGDYRTAIPGIYAAGDVIGFPALASTSMEQGARRRLPRLRLHLQEAGLAPAPVRHLHDPRSELRGPVRRGREGQGDRLRRGARLLPRQRARQDRGGQRGGHQADLRQEQPRPHRLPLHRRPRVRAGAHRPGAHLVERQGRYVDRDGVQLPDAQRDVQIRRLRGAHPARRSQEPDPAGCPLNGRARDQPLAARGAVPALRGNP